MKPSISSVDEANNIIRPISLNGKLSFLQFTQAQMMASKYPSDKKVATVLLKKGDPDVERVIAAIKAAQKLTGSRHDIVKDGDSEKLQKYNSGHHVIKVRFGPRAKVVDTAKNPIPYESFDMGDQVRLSLSLFDYSDGSALAGVSIYAGYLMLTGKGGMDSIPDYEGEGGFVASPSARTTYQASSDPLTATRAAEEESEADDDDDENLSLTARLLKQRQQVRNLAG